MVDGISYIVQAERAGSRVDLTMPELLDLPLELLERCVPVPEFSGPDGDYSDAYHCALTSRRISAVAGPILYRKVWLRTTTSPFLLARTVLGSPRLASYVKDFFMTPMVWCIRRVGPDRRMHDVPRMTRLSQLINEPPLSSLLETSIESTDVQHEAYRKEWYGKITSEATWPWKFLKRDGQ